MIGSDQVRKRDAADIPSYYRGHIGDSLVEALIGEKRYSGSDKARGKWFHGTSAARVPSILNHGMDPEPEKRSWAEDPDRSALSRDRSSFPGSYFTKNLMTAKSAGWRTAKNDDSNVAIVLADIQPMSMWADEDDVAHGIYQQLNPNIQGSVYHAIDPWSGS